MSLRKVDGAPVQPIAEGERVSKQTSEPPDEPLSSIIMRGRSHRQSAGGEAGRRVSINASTASNDLAEINNERRELELSVAISQFISKYN